MMPPGSRDLTRIVLGVLVIAGLLAGVFIVLQPFLPALMWATMIVVATWPLMRQVQRHLGGRRSLAVAVMVLLMLVVVIAPLMLAVSTVVEQAQRLPEIKLAELRIPLPPPWVEGIPLVGERIVVEWTAFVETPTDKLAERAAPYVGPVGRWIASQAGTAGAFFVHLVVTLLLCGVLYTTGEAAARGVRRFARRLHGDQGENVVLLAAASVRAVALGIVVTAVVQTALGALGLYVAGVPFVAVLGALMFVFCIAQLGPMLPMFGGVVWLWLSGATTPAVLLFLWMLVVGTMDNFLRPVLIRRGADLPLLLIMAGVIGGLLSMGLVGLFVGPVLLAVTYRLIGAWVDEQDTPLPAASPEPAPPSTARAAD
jgi:predicted PurR-regulated permease PerM